MKVKHEHCACKHQHAAQISAANHACDPHCAQASANWNMSNIFVIFFVQHLFSTCLFKNLLKKTILEYYAPITNPFGRVVWDSISSAKTPAKPPPSKSTAILERAKAKQEKAKQETPSAKSPFEKALQSAAKSTRKQKAQGVDAEMESAIDAIASRPVNADMRLILGKPSGSGYSHSLIRKKKGKSSPFMK